MTRCPIDEALSVRLHRRARADRWRLSPPEFAQALEASAGRALADGAAGHREIERVLESLHLEDLALATACAIGHETAWDHFVDQYRSVLHRSADAIQPGGGARDLADSLYADLYGLTDRDGVRRSLFRYYHGRSSLATWLRAVLAQRHVDRIRADRRLEPLPDDEQPNAAAGKDDRDPDRPRLLALVTAALTHALTRLNAHDRLRLACYYTQGLTLAQIGRLTAEHEATVSRQLTRIRRLLRGDIERELHGEHKLSEPEIAHAFTCVMDDAGAMDLGAMLTMAEERKE
jgi:RNA polymerase sigma-70 factor (ECF subfamily)